MKWQRLSTIVRIGMGFFAIWGVLGVGILIINLHGAGDLVWVVPLFLFTAALLYAAIAGRFPDIPDPDKVKANAAKRT
ncbi:MAG: hypothetical protein ACXWF6_12030 [Usitatibacter sp.]